MTTDSPLIPQPEISLTPTGRIATPFPRMMPKHYLVLDLRLQGKSNKEIAAAVGMTPEGINLIVHQPMFKKLEGERRSKIDSQRDLSIAQNMDVATRELSSGALRAVQKIEEIVETATDHKIVLDAADKFLKHAFGATEVARGAKGMINAQVLVLSDAKLDQLRRVLSQIGITPSPDPCPMTHAPFLETGSSPLPMIDVTVIDSPVTTYDEGDHVFDLAEAPESL